MPYPTDDLPMIAGYAPGPMDGRPRFPGRGYLPRPGEDRPAISEWARLCRGGAVGKSINLPFRSSGELIQRSGADTILRVQGDDADAVPLLVTLGPPQVINQTFSETLANNCANLAGSQDNLQIGDEPFSGTPGTPIIWPPIEAILTWGVGGAAMTASFDFVNGAAVAVTASFVQLSAAFERTPLDSEGSITGTSAIYRLSAFVGPAYGARGRARRTIYAGLIGEGVESSPTPIPRFARSAWVVGADGGTSPEPTSATLRFWQAPDASNCVGNFNVTGEQPLPFPIPAGAAYASVINDSDETMVMSIVYDLWI